MSGGAHLSFIKTHRESMYWYSKIPGKQYFISILIIGIVLFVTFSTIIYQNYDKAQRLNDWTLYNYEVLRLSRRILNDLVDMETGVRGYLLTGKKHFLEPYESSRITLDQQIRQLWATTKNDNTTQDNLHVWLNKIEAYSTLLSEELTTFNIQGGRSITEDKLTVQKTQLDELRNLLQTYINDRTRKLQEQVYKSNEEHRDFKFFLILWTLLAIIVMLLATMVILALLARGQRARQATAEAEERFRLVMNGINDGVYDFNPQDGTIYYSPSFKSMLGYSDENFPDSLQSIDNVLHPEDEKAKWDVFHAYERREITEYKNMFRLRHNDGGWRWILSRGVGFWNQHGQMTRLIGTHMDITEHKKREEDLAQANSDLETFTYIASHDLRSPLVNLKGFAKELSYAVDQIKPIIHSIQPQLPSEDQKALSESLDEDIPEALEFIEKSTERMDTLITAILDLSRIGKHEYHSKPVDMEAIAQKCIGSQSYEIEQKNAEVICGELPIIISDPLALEQIFSNLLDNAVKYLDPARPGKIVISAQEMHADVIFSVEDNGRGIALEDQPKIFDMFRRARNTDDVRGAGLGMSFVKATLRKLGGSIWCESKLGEGTTFYFRLPKYAMKGLAA